MTKMCFIHYLLSTTTENELTVLLFPSKMCVRWFLYFHLKKCVTLLYQRLFLVFLASLLYWLLCRIFINRKWLDISCCRVQCHFRHSETLLGLSETKGTACCRKYKGRNRKIPRATGFACVLQTRTRVQKEISGTSSCWEFEKTFVLHYLLGEQWRGVAFFKSFSQIPKGRSCEFF
jgi:hypothetical protein